MLKHLRIENFMTFNQLEIPELKPINLIAGKNNAGKTTLLDALRMLTSEAEITVINDILKRRGALRKGWDESYEALFNRNMIEGPMASSMLKINDLWIQRQGKSKEYKNFQEQSYDRMSTTLEVDIPKDEAVFVPVQSNYQILTQLWEQIALTPKEDIVLQIIQDAIEPNLIRFDVGQKQVRVRLANSSQPVPLQTLGDGVQRIFLIALSLVNAQGKVLLIDEVEMGLHYSVLEKLWRMIFHYATLWDIQVFVTTHSQDAIKAYFYVASDPQYADKAQIVRIQKNRKEQFEAVLYNGERIEKMLELDLEIR